MIPLEPGDLLICYSDGISETKNTDDEIWQESEIETILRKITILNAREVTDRVVQGAGTFAGGAEQADDMTVLTLRVL
jgi:sigma-B regulation protein RsbU (phosphoserine phosphatase)